uniref:Uncharacterized protein n=1 Tax=Populus trichocarpa TaxID=3694 RepID=A0A2K1Y1P2_POPTR
MLLKFIIQERFIYNCTLANKSHFFSSASHSQYLTNIKRRFFSFDYYIREKNPAPPLKPSPVLSPKH